MRLKVRRSLFYILAVILAATVIAFGAFMLSQSRHTAYAASGTPVPVTQSNFLDVWDNGTNTKTLQMTENVNVSSTLTVASGKNITLDLNGYALTFTGETGSVIEVKGEFTLKDSWSFVSTDDVAHMHNILNPATPATDDTVLVFGGVITGGKGKVSGSSTLGGAIYIANDGKMTMESGKISGNDISSKSDPHGGAIRNEGTFIMNGGEISYNKAVCGGGICVNDGNTEINGGAIMWNTATGDGGGVFYENTKSNVKFTFTDGAICYNTAAEVGGGVHLYSGEMTMSGGAHIYQNISEKEGGGIHVDYDSRNSTAATLNMLGGAITRNTANGIGGGGVYVNNGGIFNMSNGVIYGNKGVEGGGVYVNGGGEFTMTGGEISDNSALGGTTGGGAHYKGYGGGVYLNSTFGSSDLAKFNVSGFPSIKDNVSSDTDEDTPSNVHIIKGSIKVTGTLSSDARIGVDIFNSPDSYTVATTVDGGSISSYKSFTPDNGAYVCEYPLYGNEVDSVYVSKTHTFNVYHFCNNCGADATVTAKTGDETSYYATIGNAWAAANAAAQATEIKLLADVTTATTLEVASGKNITLDLNGCKLEFTGDSGSVIRVSGTFTLNDSDATTSHEILSPVTNENVTVNGGLITGSKNNSSGSVNVHSTGAFAMNGGAIAGNAGSIGVGVYVGGGTFNMSGGSICHNRAKAIGSNGGGVAVLGGTFTMTAGTISENSATGSGGGVVVLGGTFNISGTPVIIGNVGSENVTDNVYSYEDITVNDKLKSGAKICVRRGAVKGYTQEDKPSAFFKSDDPAKPCVYVSDTQTGEVAFGAHNLTAVAQTNATCTQAGVLAHDHCAVCENDYISGVEKSAAELAIAALGHDLTHHEAKAATCTEKGWKAYDTCSRCDHTTYEEIAAKGHDLTHHAAKEATTEAAGNSEYWSCAECEKYFSDSQGAAEIADKSSVVIPKLTPETPSTPDTPTTPETPDTPTTPETPDTPSPETPDDGGKRLSAGAIAGITVAAVMVALLAAYIACYFALFRRGVLLKGKLWDAIYKPMNAIFNKKTKE